MLINDASRLLAVMFVAAVVLSSCSGMSETQQRTLSGGAIGTAGGAVIGAIAGNTALGAVIGAGAGAVGGYVWDQHKKSEEAAYDRGYQAGKATTAQ